MKRRSLEARLSILMAGLFFALLLAVAHVQINGERTILIEERISKYQSLSNALALAYGPMSEKNDVSAYRHLASRLMNADSDISYVVITNSDGGVLFADTRKFGARSNDSYLGKRLNTVLPALEQSDIGGLGDYRKIVLPARTGQDTTGTLIVGLSARSMSAAAENVQSKVLTVFAVAFIIAILGCLLLARSIAQPVKELIQAVHAVEEGNLDMQVLVTGDDEISELRRSFNSMVVALKDSHEKLTQQANTDSLTGLYNHRYFQERLSDELSRATRYERPLSMIMLDIDHFKTLNDTHGHPFGDEVLQEVGRILIGETRDIDVVARYGGEEFAVILPETTLQDATTVAERLRTLVQRHRFTENDGSCVPVTISLGVSQYPVHSAQREGLIMAADLAMYQSKALGRNCSTAFSADIRNDKASDPFKLYLLLNPEDMSTIEAMAAAVDAKGHRTQDFSKGVMQHCIALGEELGLSEEDLRDLRIVSLLYDIGKLGIAESILMKPGKLTEEERCIIKSHPALGYAIVQKSPGLRPILPAILHHHECWDGTGYPNSLKGTDIPLMARVISVVDAFHAMTSDRPYCRASTRETAARELERCAGSQFDPKVVDAFAHVLENEEVEQKPKRRTRAMAKVA